MSDGWHAFLTAREATEGKGRNHFIVNLMAAYSMCSFGRQIILTTSLAACHLMRSWIFLQQNVGQSNYSTIGCQMLPPAASQDFLAPLVTSTRNTITLWPLKASVSHMIFAPKAQSENRDVSSFEDNLCTAKGKRYAGILLQTAAVKLFVLSRDTKILLSPVAKRLRWR